MYQHTLSQHDALPSWLLHVSSPNDRYDTKSYAVYTHNNIELIPDRLGITLGARYTHENKEFQGTQQDENSFVYRLLALPPSVLADPGDPSWGAARPTDRKSTRLNSSH